MTIVTGGGTFGVCRAVLPHLIDIGGGAIVNIGSGAAWGKPAMAVYGATKAAPFGLTMCRRSITSRTACG